MGILVLIRQQTKSQENSYAKISLYMLDRLWQHFFVCFEQMKWKFPSAKNSAK
jgi:hypothetical protein